MSRAATIATALNVGRIVYGAAAVVAPRAVGRGWIGRAAEPEAAHVMLRAFGVRDVALGAATIGTLRATGASGTGARVLMGLGVMVDAVDTVSGFIAREEIPSPLSVYVVAGGAAVAGVCALAVAEDA